MMSPCDSVAERLVLGEPLGELAAHVASCDRCGRLVAMPEQLGATRHAVDPGLGFSARMTVGAQHRLAVRRRRRIAAGLAATVAAGTLGVFVLTREPAVQAPPQPAAIDPTLSPTESDTTDPVDDADLEALVQLSNTKRSSRLSAHWSRITRPLAPYKKLLEGEAP